MQPALEKGFLNEIVDGVPMNPPPMIEQFLSDAATIAKQARRTTVSKALEEAASQFVATANQLEVPEESYKGLIEPTVQNARAFVAAIGQGTTVSEQLASTAYFLDVHWHGPT